MKINRKTGAVMVLSVLLGGTVLYSRADLPATGAATTRVVVAARDLDVGQRISPRLLSLADWPTQRVPAGVSSDPAALEGRVLSASMLHGQPVREAQLVPVGRIGALAVALNVAIPARCRLR